LELCSCAEINPPHINTGNLSRFPFGARKLDPISIVIMGLLTLFRRCRGNRTFHARQYDFSNQIFITRIGHLDACEELSQVLAHRQHRFCLPVERTKNDFVLGYRAVTLDRWYCGHGYFQNCPEGQKLAFFFGPDCGGILGLILKLFLVSVKQRPILSSSELYELRKGYPAWRRQKSAFRCVSVLQELESRSSM
jgi:hypothetical protein